MLILAPFLGIGHPWGTDMVYEITCNRERSLLEILMRVRRQLRPVPLSFIFDPVDTHRRTLKELQPGISFGKGDVIHLIDANAIGIILRSHHWLCYRDHTSIQHLIVVGIDDVARVHISAGRRQGKRPRTAR